MKEDGVILLASIALYALLAAGAVFSQSLGLVLGVLCALLLGVLVLVPLDLLHWVMTNQCSPCRARTAARAMFLVKCYQEKLVLTSVAVSLCGRNNRLTMKWRDVTSILVILMSPTFRAFSLASGTDSSGVRYIILYSGDSVAMVVTHAIELLPHLAYVFSEMTGLNPELTLADEEKGVQYRLWKDG